MGRARKSKKTRISNLQKKGDNKEIKHEIKSSAISGSVSESNSNKTIEISESKVLNDKIKNSEHSKTIPKSFNKTKNLISDKKVQSKLPTTATIQNNLDKNCDQNVQNSLRGKESLPSKSQTDNKTRSLNKRQELISIQGSFHQGNYTRYFEFAGKQCVPNSLVANIFSKISDTSTWTSSRIDTILDHGNELYIYLQSLDTITNEYILVDELPRTVEIFNKVFTLDISPEPIVGFLNHNQESNNDFIMNLYEA